jgi:hypothetical protein
VNSQAHRALLVGKKKQVLQSSGTGAERMLRASDGDLVTAALGTGAQRETSARVRGHRPDTDVAYRFRLRIRPHSYLPNTEIFRALFVRGNQIIFPRCYEKCLEKCHVVGAHGFPTTFQRLHQQHVAILERLTLNVER